jgi:hypothetical protein
MFGLYTLPWEATLTGAWGFGGNMGFSNNLSWTVSTMFFFYIVFGMVCRNWVAPFVSNERSFPCRMLFTALASCLLPYCLYRFPVWLFADADDPLMLHFYTGARANPLVRLPTFLLGMQLGAATIDNKRHPIPFNWAVLADFLSFIVICGYIAFTFMAEWTWGAEDRSSATWVRHNGVKPVNAGYGSGHLSLRVFVEFFSAPIFALWLRALSETDQSLSYKVLTLKPCMLVGEWSFVIYLSQMLVWGTTHLFLGLGGVAWMSAFGQHTNKANLPEWTRHVMVLELIVVSGVMFKLIEEPSRKFLTKRIDAAWKSKTPGQNTGLNGVAPVLAGAPAQTATKLTNATKLTLNAFRADLGVQLSEHPQGERVDAVPPESHGASIGLQVGDVITMVNAFSVKYYKGVKKCVTLIENSAEVSQAAPMSLALLRSAGGSTPEQFLNTDLEANGGAEGLTTASTTATPGPFSSVSATDESDLTSQPVRQSDSMRVCGVCNAASKFQGAKFCQKCGAAYD